MNAELNQEDGETAKEAPQKSPSDVAVKAFEDADAEYKKAQEALLSGEVAWEIASQGLMGEASKPSFLEQWRFAVEQLQTKLEDRNSKLQSACLALRDLVRINETEERGYDAKPVQISKGPFKVNSVTGRSFDVETLFLLAKRFEIYPALLELKTNKDGFEEPVVQQSWKINFEYLLTWLKANKLQGIIDGAYKEEEKTPAVTGPKPLAFLGAELKK
jgi:hypothetical protein